MFKFYFLAFIALPLACSSDSSNNRAYGVADAGYAETEMMLESSETFAYNQPDKQKVEAPAQEQKIIKTGNIDFETQDMDATYNKVVALANQYKANIQLDRSGKDYRRLYHNMALRVPSENFDQIIAGISEGVAFFDRREISQKDVTEEFVDIQARLKAKKELENRYIAILKQAKNVKEILEIERELSNIREEIEAREGRLKYLQSQVSMSTIHLMFYKTTVETGVTVSYGQKMLNSLKGGWQGVSVFFLGVLYLWPLFLLGIIAILVIRKLIRRNKKKNAK